ncbi:MAG: creatininase family protein [Chloroflexi bacterium]|nr:MAG: creatininase family protein [Chloroflexota bacterium]
MRITDMTWMQVEDYLKRDDRAVLPTGSTEQHAYLSLSVDSILAERMAIESAEPLGIPVYPVVHYGLTPYFTAYPGTVSLRLTTYIHLIRDILDSIARAGFKRILIVNGHGGNSPAGNYLQEWMSDNPGVRVKYHNWWNAPRTYAKVQEIDREGSHASWMENFPWTRLAHVALPDEKKPMADPNHLRTLNPREVREYLGDGNMGGVYQRPDNDMQAIWDAGIAETRALLEGGW